MDAHSHTQTQLDTSGSSRRLDCSTGAPAVRPHVRHHLAPQLLRGWARISSSRHQEVPPRPVLQLLHMLTDVERPGDLVRHCAHKRHLVRQPHSKHASSRVRDRVLRVGHRLRRPRSTCPNTQPASKPLPQGKRQPPLRLSIGTRRETATHGQTDTQTDGDRRSAVVVPLRPLHLPSQSSAWPAAGHSTPPVIISMASRPSVSHSHTTHRSQPSPAAVARPPMPSHRPRTTPSPPARAPPPPSPTQQYEGAMKSPLFRPSQ